MHGVFVKLTLLQHGHLQLQLLQENVEAVCSLLTTLKLYFQYITFVTVFFIMHLYGASEHEILSCAHQKVSRAHEKP